MADELFYISQNSDQSPFHLMGHLYLFLDLLTRSVSTPRPSASSKMSDYYIKEAIWDAFSVPAPDVLHRNFSSVTEWQRLLNC